MKIIRSSNEHMKASDAYRLCKSPAIRKMSDAAGQTIEIANYLFYEDADTDGNLRTICSIQTTDGDVLATNSSTFIREFGDMVDMFEAMGERVKAIRIVQGVSKGGRTFITCDVVDQ